jgi:aspartate/methionine/tyrosine aminotransferase
MTVSEMLKIPVNQNILEMEYAVRGPIPIRAAELRKQGKRTIPCNIGNPQALGQDPITYYRQILSLLEDPSRIERERRVNELVRGDAEARAAVGDEGSISDYVLDFAETILTQHGAKVGAYSDSNGLFFVREAVADFINKRDGFDPTGPLSADPEKIFLTDGASEGARHILQLLVTGPGDGIMVPIPQYPLYSATIKACNGTQVNYYPDEDAGWVFDRGILEESLAAAKKDGITVKAIVVITPGNPTGAILDRKTMEEVIDFAADNGIVIIADEVYQENVYGGEFLSFARVLGDRDVPLVSFHSVSKGFYGECGQRGGYMELRNPPVAAGTDLSFRDIIFKQASVALCSNVVGQIMVYLMVSPPPEGSEPYAQYIAERDAILQQLHDKATMLREGFTQMDSVECFGKTGAMYLFPRLNKLPAGTNDFDYCMALLEETGLVTVNGAGFGQREGTHHLRIAFLPPKEMILEVLPRWIEFHNAYVNS